MESSPWSDPGQDEVGLLLFSNLFWTSWRPDPEHSLSWSKVTFSYVLTGWAVNGQDRNTLTTKGKSLSQAIDIPPQERK